MNHTKPNSTGEKNPGPESDAQGQFAKSQADRHASGVHSAKPTVVTGSEDATVNRTPPGQDPQKDWNVSFDRGGKDESKPG